MKKFIISTVFLAVAAVIGIWVLTSQASVFVPEAVIVDASGDAKIKESGSEEWLVLENGQKLAQNDTLKTGADGRITVNFYDSAGCFVGPDSEVKLEQLYLNEQNYGETKVGLNVSAGRIWSRVVQLLDKDASYEVNSSDTVATVRGTSFDFGIDKDGNIDVSTIEGKVEVARSEMVEQNDPTTGQPQKIRKILSRIELGQGKTALMVKDEAKTIKIEMTSEERKKSQWFEENLQKNKKFEEYLKNKQEAELKKSAGVLPDSRLYALERVAEKARITLATSGEKRNELIRKFSLRRLAEIEKMASEKGVVLNSEDKTKFRETARKLLFNQNISEEDRQKLEDRFTPGFFWQKKVFMIEVDSNETIDDIRRKLEAQGIDVSNMSSDELLEQIKGAQTIVPTQ